MPERLNAPKAPPTIEELVGDLKKSLNQKPILSHLTSPGQSATIFSHNV